MSDEFKSQLACSLCGSCFRSSASNKEEKNKRRPVEEKSKEIYAIIKNIQREVGSGITCIYCRDLLRKLNKKFKVKGNVIIAELEQGLRKGTLFPRRNLKRKGSSMTGGRVGSGSRAKGSNAQNRKQSPQATQVDPSDKKQPGESNDKIEPSSSHARETTALFADGGAFEGDDGDLHNAVTERSLLMNRSQGQTLPPLQNDGLAKKRKLSQGLVRKEIMFRDSSCQAGWDQPKPRSMRGQNDLFSLLRNLHQSNSVPTDKPGIRRLPFIIPEMLSLWRINKLHVSLDMDSLPDATVEAIVSLAEFMNTGKCVSLDAIPLLVNEGVVNEYVIGLMIIQALSEMPPSTSEAFRDKSLGENPNCQLGKILSQIIELKTQGMPHNGLVMTMYEMITYSRLLQDDGYILDGETEGNYCRELKREFYYWLYHQVSLFPDHSAPELVLSRLEDGMFDSDEGTLMLHFIDVTSNRLASVCIHSLLLMLLQNSGPLVFKDNSPGILQSFGRLKIKKEHVFLLINMLYQHRPVSDQSPSPLEQIPPLDVVGMLIALRVVDPLTLFYKDFSPATPFTLKLALCFYVRTLELKYIDAMLRDPFKYLTVENTLDLEPLELQQLFMLDQVAVSSEKYLHDFLVERFGEKNQQVDKIKTKAARNLLLPCVRYPFMSEGEIDQASKEGFLSKDETIIFLLNKTSQIKRQISKRFFNATTPRMTYEQKKI